MTATRLTGLVLNPRPPITLEGAALDQNLTQLKHRRRFGLNFVRYQIANVNMELLTMFPVHHDTTNIEPLTEFDPPLCD